MVGTNSYCDSRLCANTSDVAQRRLFLVKAWKSYAFRKAFELF